MPPDIATVSFDDGFAECFTVARPLLLSHGIPATFFVCSSFVDNRALMYRNKIALCVSRLLEAKSVEHSYFDAVLRARFAIPAALDLKKWLLHLDFNSGEIINAVCDCVGVDVGAFLQKRRPYMSRDQIARLHSEGFTIGAHTSDHADLGKLRDWSEIRHQIGHSCEFVREITRETRVSFAFPFNGISLPRMKVAALRYELGIDLIYDTNNLMKDANFIVNRICCDIPEEASTRSNLPKLIRHACMLEPLRAFNRRVRLRGASRSNLP